MMVFSRFRFMTIDLLNTMLVICCYPMLCFITCIFNYIIPYLLPLAIIVDWGRFNIPNPTGEFE